MSENAPARPVVGTIGWTDLTVPDADTVRDFYSAVVGWTHQALSMGDYSDYVMTAPESGEAVSGVCHARGSNADLPAAWIVYFRVADLEASMRAVTERGGTILSGPKGGGEMGRWVVVKDPAGAVCALHQQ